MPLDRTCRRLGPVWGRLALRYGADMGASSLTVRELADELNVDSKAVRAWMRRQNWRHPVEPHRQVRSALPTVAATGRQGSRHEPSAAGHRGRRAVRTFFTRSRPASGRRGRGCRPPVVRPVLASLRSGRSSVRSARLVPNPERVQASCVRRLQNRASPRSPTSNQDRTRRGANLPRRQCRSAERDQKPGAPGDPRPQFSRA